jgi:hypothetical protein
MSRDLRGYQRSTERRLIVGFILLLVVVGDGLIYLIYGPSAAVSGLICIAAGLSVLGLLGIVLWLLDRLSRRLDG